MFKTYTCVCAHVTFLLFSADVALSLRLSWLHLFRDALQVFKWPVRNKPTIILLLLQRAPLFFDIDNIRAAVSSTRDRHNRKTLRFLSFSLSFSLSTICSRGENFGLIIYDRENSAPTALRRGMHNARVNEVRIYIYDNIRTDIFNEYVGVIRMLFWNQNISEFQN